MVHLSRYRSFYIIGVIVLLSALYVRFVFSVIGHTTSAECDAEAGVQIKVFIFDLMKIECKPLTANEVGDYFAGLISLLATFWLVIAFIWQAMELALQREEFKKSNDLAVSRINGEEVLRKIDLHRALVVKLEATVEEKLRCMSLLSGTPRMLTERDPNSLRLVALESIEIYNSRADFQEHKSTFERLKIVDQSARAELNAMDNLRKDPVLSDVKILLG